MTELDEMWVEFEKHQSIADDKGHGDTWAEMCRLRTEKACTAASKAAYADAVVAVDAVCGWFAAAAAAAAYAAAVVAVDAVCGGFAAAADAAADAAKHAAAAKYAAAKYAAAAAAAAAEYWMQEAIKRINHAIKLAEKQK